MAVAVYGNVVDDRRRDRREPQDAHRRHGQVPAAGLSQRVGDAADDAHVDDGLDEHEQADEEEQRVPLDVAQGLVRI